MTQPQLSEVQEAVERLTSTYYAGLREEYPALFGQIDMVVSALSSAEARVAEQPWQPISSAPRKGYINVRSVTTYRWHPYRPGAPKNLLAKGGRWQRATKCGWENADPPEGSEFVPNLPLTPPGQPQ